MDELETQPENQDPQPAAAEEQDQESSAPHASAQTVSIEEWMQSSGAAVQEAPQAEAIADAQLLAVLEACVYVAEDPLMPAQIASALNQDPKRVQELLDQLVAEFDRVEHGVGIRVVAGGYKMATKAEHHEAVRNFVKSLKAPLKLSLPALETLAVVAYKQPVTAPEIMDIRGVQGGGVLKTLLDRKLITEAGRKNVIGKPILYKTTKEFLIQFGLKDVAELPSLKEFEEIRRMAMADSEMPAEAETPAPAVEPAAEPAQATAAPDAPAEAAESADAAVTPDVPSELAESAAPSEAPEQPAETPGVAESTAEPADVATPPEAAESAPEPAEPAPTETASEAPPEPAAEPEIPPQPGGEVQGA